MYIPTIGLQFLLEEICRTILGLYKSLTDTLMLKLGLAEAALFPEKEYINGIFVALRRVFSEREQAKNYKRCNTRKRTHS
jgi:hypothetical protein